MRRRRAQEEFSHSPLSAPQSPSNLCPVWYLRMAIEKRHPWPICKQTKFWAKSSQGEKDMTSSVWQNGSSLSCGTSFENLSNCSWLLVEPCQQYHQLSILKAPSVNSTHSKVHTAKDRSTETLVLLSSPQSRVVINKREEHYRGAHREEDAKAPSSCCAQWPLWSFTEVEAKLTLSRQLVVYRVE